jgi:hypothetical protein
VIVKDLKAVLKSVVRKLAAKRKLGWPANVPANIIPFSLQIDAGGGTTKVVLKLIPALNSDSAKSLTLVGILSNAKDTTEAIHAEINAEGLWVDVGWLPALPADRSLEFAEDGISIQACKRQRVCKAPPPRRLAVGRVV